MCNLTTELKYDKVIVFKLAAKKKGTQEYYSLAMGSKYPKDGNIRRVRRQNRLSRVHANDILINPNIFEENMIGRTAGYSDYLDAVNEKRVHIDLVEEGYTPVILVVELSEDLMKGKYGASEVYAGRHIKILTEVD